MVRAELPGARSVFAVAVADTRPLVDVGRVRICQHARTGRIAAAKIVPLDFMHKARAASMSKAAANEKSEKLEFNSHREILMMKLMDHPNIMRLYDVLDDHNELCVF